MPRGLFFAQFDGNGREIIHIFLAIFPEISYDIVNKREPYQGYFSTALHAVAAISGQLIRLYRPVNVCCAHWPAVRRSAEKWQAAIFQLYYYIAVKTARL